MDIEPLDIAGAWVIRGRRFSDDRGWFQEWFKQSALLAASGVSFAPVQTNISKSSAGVVRGIHYSIAPQGQGKLVTVMNGEIDDYVIDVRQGSPTYKKWIRVRLSSDTGDAVLIDPHLAHAFQSLRNDTIVSYLVTAEFDPEMEKAITPFSEEIDINWSRDVQPLVSTKDFHAPTLSQMRKQNLLPETR